MKTSKSILLLILLIVLLFSAVYGFTSHSFVEGYDLRNTGQIGDTIGGIVGPIINLLGALLVYYSFQEQRKANEIQIKVSESQGTALQEEKDRTNALNKFNQLVSLMDDIEKSIKQFKVTSSDGTPVSYSGIEAFGSFLKYVSGLKNDKLTFNIKDAHQAISWYINFLKFCLYTIDNIRAYDYNDPLTKEVLYVKFINMISILDSHLSDINHHTNGMVNKDLNVIHDYTHEIKTQVHYMKTNTSHFKPQ